MFKVLVITLVTFLSVELFAHEGHGHGPSQVQAPKGGIIRSLETVHVELIVKGNTLELYAYGLDLKPMQVKAYPATATVTLPRKPAQKVALVDKGDHWQAEYDAKGAHRYGLELAIRQGGHDDKIKFNVEPKK